jgi:SAM-dependent methyltransferase
LGVVADADFEGYCLDVSSPKLLPSLLQREGRGIWTCVDLFTQEIDNWAELDPDLDLGVEDATRMTFEDGRFDRVVCLSVLEHVGRGGDSRALDEIWRVLRPGGVLHLTTDVARTARDIAVSGRIYGEASDATTDGAYFFKHDYAVDEIDAMLAAQPWTVLRRQYTVARNPAIEQLFYRFTPWSYAAGGLLRLVCPRNFAVSDSPDLLPADGHGVVYLVLRKDERLEPVT